MKTSFLATATLLTVSFLVQTAQAGNDFGITFGGKDWQVTLGDNDPHRLHPIRRVRRYPHEQCVTHPQPFPQPYPYPTPQPTPQPNPYPYPAPQPNPYPQPFPTPQPLPPMTQSLPADLQGRWYEVSPHNTRYIYDLRANDYDMYEVDPATNQVIHPFGGQPLMLQNESLAYSNGMLTLSPGPDQDGPLMISAPPAQYPMGKTMTPLTGGAPRYFTRRPVNMIKSPKTIPPVSPQVKGDNVKAVHFTMNNTASRFAQVAKGIWVEISPEGVTQFQETGRDEWSVYLTRTDGVVKAQLDLYRKMILVDGRDTHQISKVQ